MNDTDKTVAANAPDKRWWKLLYATIVINGVAYMIYPAFICGCHFQAVGAIFSAIPIAWGFCLLFFYRTRIERFVTWGAIALSLIWIWFAVDSNLKFLYMRTHF